MNEPPYICVRCLSPGFAHASLLAQAYEIARAVLGLLCIMGGITGRAEVPSAGALIVGVMLLLSIRSVPARCVRCGAAELIPTYTPRGRLLYLEAQRVAGSGQ